MQKSADGLNLTHTFPKRNAFGFPTEKAVRISLYRLNPNGNRGCSPERFHERVILLYVSDQFRRQFRQGRTLSLRAIEYRNGFITRNLNCLFLRHNLSVRVPDRRMRHRVQFFHLNRFLERRGRENFDSFLAFFHMPSEFVFPFLKSGAICRGRALRPYQNRVVQAVTVEF